MANKKAPTKKKNLNAAHVNVDGKKYKVAPLFKFGGESYTAADAVKNKELIASLIKANSFVITEVTDKTAKKRELI